MPGIQKTLRDAVGKLLFRQVKVSAVTDIAPLMRKLDLEGDSIRGANVRAGDKVQLVLDGGVRTYTPFAFDAVRGRMSLFVYVHGDGPGARWGKAASTSTRLEFLGPRGSLALSDIATPVVLFGDETSFGVARALLEQRGDGRPSSFVFEVSNPTDSAQALSHLGVTNHDLVARAEVASHLQTVEEKLRARLAQHPGAKLVLTGQARSIQALRAALRSRPAPHAGQLVKAYWAPGKRGLD